MAVISNDKTHVDFEQDKSLRNALKKQKNI